MSSRRIKSVTLTELLIAMILLFLIVMGFSSIETFSRRGLLATARRSEIQSEASFVLNHIAKQALKGIGSQGIAILPAVDLAEIAGDASLRIFVDAAADHESPGNGIDKRVDTLGGDCWRAYRYRDNLSPPGTRNQIWYYHDYQTPTNTCDLPECEILARKVQSFVILPPGPTLGNQNYFEVTISSCWDPTQNPGLDNPCVTASNRVAMPSVSTQ